MSSRVAPRRVLAPRFRLGVALIFIALGVSSIVGWPTPSRLAPLTLSAVCGVAIGRWMREFTAH